MRRPRRAWWQYTWWIKQSVSRNLRSRFLLHYVLVERENAVLFWGGVWCFLNCDVSQMDPDRPMIHTWPTVIDLFWPLTHKWSTPDRSVADTDTGSTAQRLNGSTAQRLNGSRTQRLTGSPAHRLGEGMCPGRGFCFFCTKWTSYRRMGRQGGGKSESII